MHDDHVPKSLRSSGPREPADVARLFQEAYDTYLDPLCRYVYTYVKSWDTARDLVSDVFAKLWLRLAAAEPVQHAQAFLYRTARNHAIDYLRRQQVRTRYDREHAAIASHEGEPALAAEIEQYLTERDLVAALQYAVDQLSPQQRQVVLLRWRGEATNTEVAAALGIAPNTASEHFRRAIEQLRSVLPDLLRKRL